MYAVRYETDPVTPSKGVCHSALFDRFAHYYAVPALVARTEDSLFTLAEKALRNVRKDTTIPDCLGVIVLGTAEKGNRVILASDLESYLAGMIGRTS